MSKSLFFSVHGELVEPQKNSFARGSSYKAFIGSTAQTAISMPKMKEMKNTEMTNERIKKVKKLREPKERAEKRLFLIEGVRLLEEAVKEEADIEEVLFTEKLGDSVRGSHILASLRKMDIQTSQIPEKVMDALSETETPQGITAVVKQLNWGFKDMTEERKTVVIACGLQDPGNLGTIIRTADAGGCGGVITTNNAVDAYNHKVIRATMGSIFRMPVVKVADRKDIISELKKAGYQIIATTAHSRSSYLDIDYTKPSALLIGQEGSGISEEWLESADFKAFIPMKEGVESLNAAVSASIMIYEAFRQRLMQRL